MVSMIEQARVQWVGRRVWCAGWPFQGYAVVEAIDERGFVILAFEQVVPGQTSSVRMAFESLGVAIKHAD